jgi:hypothetical protein
MTGPPGEFDQPIDEFEAHARIWRAQHGLARDVAALCERVGLDPEVAERMHRAAVEEADHTALTRALADFTAALAARLEEDPALASRWRRAMAEDPEFKEGVRTLLTALMTLEEPHEEDED